MRRLVTLMHVWGLSLAVVASCWATDAKPEKASDLRPARGDGMLPQELQALQRMRAGKNTPFDEVERRGRDLLKEHESAGARGQIYYHLADVHGQSGMVHPELIVEYAQRALRLPIEPAQRLRLYNYWGDALQVLNRGQKIFPEIRKLAAVPYLVGLKDAQKYRIPQARPQMPLGMFYDIPKSDPNYEQIKKEAEARAAAQEQARIHQELWDNRRILTGQIVSIYARKPHAASELRQLAAQILADPAAVDRLMKLVEERGALKDDPIQQTR